MRNLGRISPIVGFIFLLVHHCLAVESHHNMTDKERYDLKYVVRNAHSVDVYAIIVPTFTGRRRGTCSIMHIERTWKMHGQRTN